MSNLGGYQTMTRFIKSVGGPKNALALGGTAALGIFAAGGATYAGGQKAVKSIRLRLASRTDPSAGKLFIVREEGEDGNGLTLSVGSTYRVLEKDREAVVIELFDDDDNPYVTSAEFLERVSMPIPEAEHAEE
ncbi:hypothetical protein [Nesterenkonia haasae]|uniref:hypothetical protein n=1 Tax=Nesterenkonia haasae TaxID=2587813 RepID=UPI001391B205|nr:hypothetical protein [Nesterenkonia haasae]NDK30202.1 hypothetical protein [Nesterenkonia haasae]